MIKAVIHSAHSRLFKAGSWLDYTICRTLLYSFIFLRSFRLDTSEFMLLPDSLFTPYGLSGFYPSLPSYSVVRAVEIVWQIALALGILGIASRWVSWIIFICGFFLMDLTFAYGTHWRIDTPLIFGLLLFAVSSGGDGDKGALWKINSLRSAPLHSEAFWPLEFFRWTVRIFMFCAGLSKLQHSGLEWVLSDNLENQIKLASVLRSSFPFPELSFWLRSAFIDLPLVCKFLAGTVLFCELASPFSILWKKFDFAVHLILFTMLLLAPVLLHVDSTTTLAIFVFFVPWSRLTIGRFSTQNT